jgi:hypothetical protein
MKGKRREAEGRQSGDQPSEGLPRMDATRMVISNLRDFQKPTHQIIEREFSFRHGTQTTIFIEHNKNGTLT